MSNKVVYLFGAGASFNAIPVVSGMAKRMQTFLNYYKFHDTRNDINLSEPKAKILDKWEKLIAEVAECFSIDTLARRAYLSDDMHKLSDIKQIIGAYILWEQIVKPNNNASPYLVHRNINSILTSYRESVNRFNYTWDGNNLNSVFDPNAEITLRNYDYRYESLLTLIATERYKLDAKFSFISWNYDNQMEIAVNRIFNLDRSSPKDITQAEEWKNRKLHEILGNNFIKLNGSGSLSNFDFEPLSRFDPNSENNEIDRIHKFLTGREDFVNRILFAWEESAEFDRQRAITFLKEAKYIVIIGYSFPEYNRQIDKQLIDAASIGLNSEIIIQDTSDNIGRIISRINSIKPGLKIKEYMDLNQFYIPL